MFFLQKFNIEMLRLKNIAKIDIPCIEAGDRHVGKSKRKPKKKKPGWEEEKEKPASETGGLETTLTIGVGARIMLRRNLNVARGLVNGAVGVIKRINVR